jgi:quinol monooxygenase YgiN
MIARIVDLQINPSEFDRARQLIEEVAPKVRSFAGCTYLELNFDIHKKGHVQT